VYFPSANITGDPESGHSRSKAFRFGHLKITMETDD
jgi:hypothetical protein